MTEPTAARTAPRAIVLVMPLAASLTLGLAPFVPEPHVIGKLRWVAGGAHGMVAMDWMDLAFHGTPWVWLLGAVGVWAWRRWRAAGVAR